MQPVSASYSTQTGNLPPQNIHASNTHAQTHQVVGSIVKPIFNTPKSIQKSSSRNWYKLIGLSSIAALLASSVGIASFRLFADSPITKLPDSIATDNNSTANPFVADTASELLAALDTSAIAGGTDDSYFTANSTLWLNPIPTIDTSFTDLIFDANFADHSFNTDTKAAEQKDAQAEPHNRQSYTKWGLGAIATTIAACALKTFCCRQPSKKNLSFNKVTKVKVYNAHEGEAYPQDEGKRTEFLFESEMKTNFDDRNDPEGSRKGYFVRTGNSESVRRFLKIDDNKTVGDDEKEEISGALTYHQLGSSVEFKNLLVKDMITYDQLVDALKNKMFEIIASKKFKLSDTKLTVNWMAENLNTLVQEHEEKLIFTCQKGLAEVLKKQIQEQGNRVEEIDLDPRTFKDFVTAENWDNSSRMIQMLENKEYPILTDVERRLIDLKNDRLFIDRYEKKTNPFFQSALAVDEVARYKKTLQEFGQIDDSESKKAIGARWGDKVTWADGSETKKFSLCALDKSDCAIAVDITTMVFDDSEVQAVLKEHFNLPKD